MEQQQNIVVNKIETPNKASESNATDLTRMLFESQSNGLADLYEKLNKSISINKIIEDSKSFQKSSNRSLRQICR